MSPRKALTDLALLLVAAGVVVGGCDRRRPPPSKDAGDGPWASPPSRAQLEIFVRSCAGGAPRTYGSSSDRLIASTKVPPGVLQCDARWSESLGHLESVSVTYYVDDVVPLPVEIDVARFVAPIATILPERARQTALSVAERRLHGGPPDIVDGGLVFGGGRMESSFTLTVAVREVDAPLRR